MDFGTLLHTAQKNEKFAKKEPARYYSTKFEPPKKEQRNKQLSDNIKKFLAKKEHEENLKRREANKKRENLLALRAKDTKATRRVNVMLKRTKSANQSVIQDAVDKNNTSVTLTGPDQPDEDDYGYVSQEAAAYYSKMMEKYSKLPTEPRFTLDKKKKAGSLSSTKDRVRAALEREKEEASQPHRRRRKPQDACEPETADEEPHAPVKKKKPAPPPPALNFNDLLKLAEKKQFEPIVIEPKVKEEERPLTKKQKKEFDREREWKERRESKPSTTNAPLAANRIPKLSQDKPKTNDIAKPARTGENAPKREVGAKKAPNQDTNRKPFPAPSTSSAKSKPSRPQNVPSKNSQKSSEPLRREADLKRREMAPKSNDVLRRDLGKAREFPARDPQRLPPKMAAAKQFPAGEVRRKVGPRKMLVSKGRILDDDEEYDSEMDDFIDDGPGEEEDYSKYISEIFGYDKSKYRNLDDDVDNMESTFAQQMREEAISKKIGIMEDLEDMKMEEEEKKLKAIKKRK